MQLDEESKRRIAEWLESKVGEMTCLMCGGEPLIAVNIARLPSATIGHDLRRQVGQAVVNMQCGRCGYFHLFDAGVIGVDLSAVAED